MAYNPLFTIVLIFTFAVKECLSEGTLLSLPIPKKCLERPKEFLFGNHNYFISSHVPALNGTEVNWLEARNICREYCMDLVSMETIEENNLITKLIKEKNIPYIWTSGRLCDFAGCDNGDLYPKNINGWFWSATRGKIAATNRIPKGWGKNPWSQTGYKKKPQPDDAEYGVNGTHEPCMAVLNTVYADGIFWHDVACYHMKPFFCEDSDSLLEYVRATNPELKIN